MRGNNLYLKIVSKILNDINIKLHKKLNQPVAPTYINWKITNKCNSRCTFCNIWEIYNKNKDVIKNELNFEEIVDIFLRNSKYFKNIREMQITGGEPFLKPKLAEIILELHKIIPKSSFWLPTNGLVPNKVKSVLETIYSSSYGTINIGVGVSIDGSRELHDSIRGVNGAYDSAVKTIETLIDLKSNYPKLNVACSFTISATNFHDIDHVIELCNYYGIYFTFRPVNTSSIYYDNVNIMEEMNERFLVNLQNFEVNFKKIETFIMSSCKSFYEKILDLYFLDGCKSYIKSPNYRKLSCYAGYTSFFLDPYGTVYPCIGLEKPLGNLKKQSFKEIWFSKKAFEVRKLIKELQCPKCWVECETYRDIQLNLLSLAIFALKKKIGSQSCQAEF